MTKSKRYGTYIFSGVGSKHTLRRFLEYNEEYKVVAQILDKKGYRQFIPFKSWEDCWEKYKHEKYISRHLSEVVLSDRVCKPYLDIEWEEKNANEGDYSEFIRKIKVDIKRVFKERYKIGINEKNIKISSSHSEKKVSFHVTVNENIAYKTNLKNTSDSAWDLYVALTEMDKTYKGKLDESVYSLDREMRAVYSTKYGEYRPLVPLGEKFKNGLFCDDVLDHLITNISKPEMIKTPEYVNPKREIIRGIEKISELKGNHVTSKTEDEIIIRIKELLQAIHPTASYTGKTQDNMGWRFTYEDRTETCYTGHIHSNNGFCVYIKPSTGKVYMYCYSKKCQQLYFLGYMDRNENWKHESIKINQQYLDYKENYAINDVIDNEGTELYGFINNFIEKGGIYAIKSSMGTGKTRMLEKIIEKKFMDKRILYLSHRQTFTQNIYGSFAKYGFGCYLKKEYKKDKVIVQIDSLLNIPINGKRPYDLIIMDEIESLLAHISSQTLKYQRLQICKFLEFILKNAKCVLAMDADFDNRSYEFLSLIKERPKVLINEYKPVAKKFMLTSNYETRKFQLNEDVKNGKKVVVICLCISKLDELYEYLKKENPNAKILRYSSMTDDEQKTLLADVNNVWSKNDVILYTPTIEAGVDFNVKNYFNRMYCFLNNKSCSPRAFMQMVGRIRDLGDNNIRCHYDKGMLFTDKDIYIPTIDEFEEHHLYNANLDCELTWEMIDGNMETTSKKTAFTRVYAYNNYEKYVKFHKFLKTLKELLSINGHTYLDEDMNKQEKDDEKEIVSDSENETQNTTLKSSSIVDEPDINLNDENEQNTTVSSKKTIYEIDELVLTPSITEKEANELEKIKNSNMASRSDKLCLKRYYIEKKFKLKPEEFTTEFLLSWHNKDYILDNALYVCDKKNYSRDPDKGIIKEKIVYLNKILGVYGFNNIFDFDKTIEKDDGLEKRMKDSELLKKDNYMKMMKLFGKKIKNSIKDTFSVNKFTSMTNCILNEYGIKIGTKRKKIKKLKQQGWLYTYKLTEERTNIYKLCMRY